jgi:hypothetical protein
VYETSQEQNQLITLQKLPAEPFIFIGNICKREKESFYRSYTLIVICVTTADKFSMQATELSIKKFLTSDTIIHGIAPSPKE